MARARGKIPTPGKAGLARLACATKRWDSDDAPRQWALLRWAGRKLHLDGAGAAFPNQAQARILTRCRAKAGAAGKTLP